MRRLFGALLIIVGTYYTVLGLFVLVDSLKLVGVPDLDGEGWPLFVSIAAMLLLGGAALASGILLVRASKGAK